MPWWLVGMRRMDHPLLLQPLPRGLLQVPGPLLLAVLLLP